MGFAGRLAWSVTHAALAAPALAGCLALLAAGRRERRGDLRGSRALARRGGFLVGAFGALLAGASTLAPSPTDPLLRAGAVVAAASAAAVGLLGGVAGKPRPSNAVATALLIASALAFHASLG